MEMYPLLLLHICVGVTGFLSGVAALFLRKGSRPHRIAGNVFFISMLAMSGAGAYMAEFIKLRMINVIAGLITFYLVATGWLTVLRRDGRTGRLEYGILLIGAFVAALSLTYAWKAAHSATGLADRTDVGDYLMFGSIGALAIAGDAVLLIRGGIFGAARISRHVWRMCVPLLLATVSLFVGTPSRLLVPAIIRDTRLAFVPIIIVAATSLFWLVRVLSTKPYRKGGGRTMRKPSAATP